MRFICILLFTFGILEWKVEGYIPGAMPVTFNDGKEIGLKVAQLTSVHTQIPFDYYSLPFCEPETLVKDHENLGEILRGDRVENSPYKLKFGVDEKCKFVCWKNLKTDEADRMMRNIYYQYRVHWFLDNLPAATKQMAYDRTGSKDPIIRYDNGFALGGKVEAKEGDAKSKARFKLNNHVDITVLMNKEEVGEKGKGRIVGFEVIPHSRNYGDKVDAENFPCNDNRLPVLEVEKKETNVSWTYSVHWQEAKIPWINRWDRYLSNTDPQIHWFSIINSLMIVVFLTGMMAMIMMRTLHADFRRYNQEMGEEIEETGWKLVHGDVFRPPAHPMLLSVLIGSGVQVFGMAMVTLVFAALGFLSPANRGGLINFMLAFFVLMGVFAGYASTRNFRMMKGNSWKKCTVYTAITFPGIVFSIFFVLNIAFSAVQSTGAVPFLSLISIVALWVGVSTPLVFLGSYYAYKQPDIQHPVRTNQIPRQVPEQIWYMHPIFSILMGGILPFGAVFIELFFIFSSVWGQQHYYIYGFLLMVFVILILTCSEITIIMCYFQLCSEDYHWWWRSFLTAGSSAFYMLLYAIYYYSTRLELQGSVPKMLYCGYSLIMTFGFFVFTGSIGYFSCYLFVKKIYSQVKVD
eukprot:TRINITY_DN88_c0_g1_i1.p1 TRINITY_DN88_c0_g1~~TRINITY_DN88_c0_g1_i1.p1  ORF type:complete len:650 (+),score=178.82 TRINITY_DN88_c0_g1_i1:58-1950(+)